eukprot:9171401-Karenia_brevis.AAC.1
MLAVKFEDLTFSHNTLTLYIPLSKSGRRRGVPETILLTDDTAIFALALLSKYIVQKGLILQGSRREFRSEFTRLLKLLHLQHLKLLPYSIRRGGATAHWQRWRNMKYTTELGRWKDLRTARLYLEEGQAQMEIDCLPPLTLASLRATSILLDSQLRTLM